MKMNLRSNISRPSRRAASAIGMCIFLVVGGATLTSCATSNGVGAVAGGEEKAPSEIGANPDQAVVLEEAPSQEQLAALKDWEVSPEENQKGYQLYKQCLSEAGFTIIDKESQGALLDYAIPDGAVTSGVDAVCYGRHFKQIDIMWQQQNAAGSETVALLEECLQTHGVQPSDDASKLEGQLRDKGIQPSDCALGR